jgi:hypothetical protein
MYQNATLGVGVSAAALPFTGFNIVWLLISAFALAMAAGAVLRTVPKRAR